MAPLERLAETHRRYPAAPLFMGIGNITELTAADTTGVNALLVAICEEVGVRAVLTTEVIPWARGAVREIDIARRLMHHAVTRQALPKGVDDRLVTLKDPKILAYGEAELRALHRAVTDPNFRIFADEQVITVFNNEIFVRGTDINDLFAQLGVDEATHAFYLGRELMKAKIAITLGKTYRQEGQLQWGYLTPQEEPSQHVLLTQRSRRRRAGRPRTPRGAPPGRARPRAATLPGRSGRLHRLRLGRDARADPAPPLRRPRHPRRRARSLRLGDRVGPPGATGVGDLHRDSRAGDGSYGAGGGATEVREKKTGG